MLAAPSQEVEKVDVANKTITFATTGGAELTQKYDVLVGAEGPVSITRKVLVKNDKTMQSQLSYIGPMRYVSARALSAQYDTSSDQFKLLTTPPDTSQSQPAAVSGGLHANGEYAILCLLFGCSQPFLRPHANMITAHCYSEFIR